MSHEEWIIVRHSTDGLDEPVIAGDQRIPRNATVTIRQRNAARGLGRPDAELRFEIRAGGAGCTEFHIVSKPGDRMIHARDLAMIDLDLLAQAAFDHWAQPIEEPSEERSRTVLDRVMHETKTGRIRERHDVARIYLAEMLVPEDARDGRRKPAEAVRQAMGYQSIATANRRIKDARERGLIPPVGASEEEQRAALAQLEGGTDDGEAQ